MEISGEAVCHVIFCSWEVLRVVASVCFDKILCMPASDGVVNWGAVWVVVGLVHPSSCARAVA